MLKFIAVTGRIVVVPLVVTFPMVEMGAFWAIRISEASGIRSNIRSNIRILWFTIEY